MSYLGGKFRVRYQVSELINGLAPRTYLEPFCGYCWVGERVRCPRRFFSDANKSLVLMWQALQTGWVPPTSMTEKEFLSVRERGEISALRGFIESSCSFNGCWGGGFKGTGKWEDPAPSASRALRRRIRSLAGAVFHHRDYLKAFDSVDADIIYCDPPYADVYQRYMDGWSSTSFSTDRFWDEVRKRSDGRRRILVSEYAAPADFTVVLAAHSRMGLTARNESGDLTREKRLEKVFEYQPPKGRRMVSFGSLIEGHA